MRRIQTADYNVRRNTRVALVLSCVFILTLGLGLYVPEAVLAKDTSHPSARTTLQVLKGNWVRPDGGYILKLYKINKDGSISAAYFNPQPIRVFRAEAKKKKGSIILIVELRDINYPGSQYNLRYDSETDTLRGKYYQAFTKQTFDVMFVRNK